MRFPAAKAQRIEAFIIRAAGDPRRALGEFRGAIAALNAQDSNTGMNLFRAAIASVASGAPFFSSIAVTGSHQASVIAVAEGRADLASIDCVSFALIERGRPELIERVADRRRKPAFALPAVHRLRRLPGSTIGAVRDALFAALADPGLAETRAALGLTGARIVAPADYDRVIEIERDAAEAGYPVLR